MIQFVKKALQRVRNTREAENLRKERDKRYQDALVQFEMLRDYESALSIIQEARKCHESIQDHSSYTLEDILTFIEICELEINIEYQMLDLYFDKLDHMYDLDNYVTDLLESENGEYFSILPLAQMVYRHALLTIDLVQRPSALRTIKTASKLERAAKVRGENHLDCSYARDRYSIERYFQESLVKHRKGEERDETESKQLARQFYLDRMKPCLYIQNKSEESSSNG